MLDLPDPWDDEFPSGDGTADVEAEVTCPYCGAENEISLDPGGGTRQEYEEDCQVCCRTWRVTVQYDGGGGATVAVEPLT
jgi:transposase-like protein